MSRIVEIAVEVPNDKAQVQLEKLLRANQYAFYVEPPRDPPWASLEDAEAQCEGK